MGNHTTVNSDVVAFLFTYNPLEITKKQKNNSYYTISYLYYDNLSIWIYVHNRIITICEHIITK